MRSNAIKCSHFPGNSSHCTLCIVHFTLWFYIVHFTLWFYFVPPQHTSKLCTSQAPLLIRLKQLESYRTGTHFEATIASSLGLTDQLVEKTRKGQKVSGRKTSGNSMQATFQLLEQPHLENSLESTWLRLQPTGDRPFCEESLVRVFTQNSTLKSLYSGEWY